MKSGTTNVSPVKSIAMLAIAVLLCGLSGCYDLEAHNRRARESLEAKARADAARKEMDALPKVFQTPDYFRVNQSAPKDPQSVPGKTDQ